MIYWRTINSKLNQIELSKPYTYKNICSSNMEMENEKLDMNDRYNGILEQLTAITAKVNDLS